MYSFTSSAVIPIPLSINVSVFSSEFCNEYRAKEVIEKYCSFMPVPIYFKNENAVEEEAEEEESFDETEETSDSEANTFHNFLDLLYTYHLTYRLPSL